MIRFVTCAVLALGSWVVGGSEAIGQATRPAQREPRLAASPKVQLAPSLPEPAGGRMEIAEIQHAVGNVEDGEAIAHDFIIKNTGTGPLTIHAKPG